MLDASFLGVCEYDDGADPEIISQVPLVSSDSLSKLRILSNFKSRL